MSKYIYLILLFLISCVSCSSTNTHDEYFVVGEVVNPGTYILTTPLRTHDAIENAGGFTKQADMSRIKIYRDDNIIEYKVIKTTGIPPGNILIKHHDIIVIQKRNDI